MIALLAAVSLSFPLLRIYARKVEHSDGDPVDKLHRLRRAGLLWALLLVPVFAVAAVEQPLDSTLLGDASPVVTLVALPIALIASLVGAYLGIRPHYERLRGIEGTTKGATRRTTRLLLVLLAPQAVWLAVLFLLLRLDVHPLLMLAAVLAFLVSVGVCGPLLIRTAMPTRALEPREEKRLTELCAQHGVAIRGVRVIDTRHDPAVNALFSGLGPGPKYVFVTDRLLEAFETDELAAVLAHEIAHRKKHHIGIKLAASLGTAIVTGGVLSLVVLVTQIPAAVAAILIPMLLLGSMLLVQGTLGIRLEHQADDYAASTVGADALRRALGKMAELNMLKRRTGWLWNTLQQHPGLDSRMERVGRPAGGSDSTNPWIYLPAAPIVLVMVVALINDPGRMGEVAGSADMPVGVFLVIALVMTGLMAAVWALSRFRYRTVVVLLQIAVVWVGGLLYVIDVRNHVSGWDLAEDGVLLVTTLLQLVPGRRTP